MVRGIYDSINTPIISSPCPPSQSVLGLPPEEVEAGFPAEDCGRKVCLPVVVLAEGGGADSEGSNEGAGNIPGGIFHGFAVWTAGVSRTPVGMEGLKETTPEFSAFGADQGSGEGSGVSAWASSELCMSDNVYELVWNCSRTWRGSWGRCMAKHV